MKEPHQELLEYYEERAPEYDELYLGKGPALSAPDAYIGDVRKISALCKQFGRGHLIDIGCGTGYWLQYYSNNCKEITLVDQSRNMLVECQKKTRKITPEIGINFIKGNFFHLRFLSRIFDSALIGFLISHLPSDEERIFFTKIKGILRPKASILWIDGAWSPLREKFRKKEGFQERRLNDGRSFSIFKRYFDEEDIRTILEKHTMMLESLYMGEVFFAAQCALPD